MYINEQYTLYKIAHQLVAAHQFDVLYINERFSEIWLEKFEQKNSKVIRLIHKGFDWKNFLKKDIAGVFQRAKRLKQVLASKNIEVYNVYITTYPPVDSWEELKKPMKLKEKNPIRMNLYYLEESDYKDELKRLETDMGMKLNIGVEEGTKENQINQYKIFLKKALQRRRQEFENIFTYGKPFLTYGLVIINILIFILLEMRGGSTNIQTLIEFGAKYNPAILVDGEWWRIISSMFLHIGSLHLLMNMLAIYFLGSVVERIFGSARFMFIYFLSGIGGGLASFALAENIAAGASGAIFGLFGALLFFGINYKRLFFQTMGQGVLLIIAINIILGFTVEQIDMAAHLGGLITGFVASFICHLPRKKDIKNQLIAAIVYAAIIIVLVTYGIHNGDVQAVL